MSHHYVNVSKNEMNNKTAEKENTQRRGNVCASKSENEIEENKREIIMPNYSVSVPETTRVMYDDDLVLVFDFNCRTWFAKHFLMPFAKYIIKPQQQHQQQ